MEFQKIIQQNYSPITAEIFNEESLENIKIVEKLELSEMAVLIF